MARYIENLNTCSDPTSGDYLWIVDASASSSDKDRKVDVGLFPRLAAENTFTSRQIINAGSGAPQIMLSPKDNGTGVGGYITLGNNTNGSTPAAGIVVFVDKGGTSYNVWADDSGLMRVYTIAPTFANDTAGTVIGTQTSSLDSKDVLEGVTGIEDVLAAVQAGAEAVRRFTYKSGAYNDEEFEGVVVDFQPRYGMDRDAEHPAGKSLNTIVLLGDLLRAAANFDLRLRALEGRAQTRRKEMDDAN